jgi:putative colanic acid biosynthesis UDP-glucose lipid carrier transferase
LHLKWRLILKEKNGVMVKEKHSPIFRIILTDLLILNMINLFFIFIVKKYNFRSLQREEQYLLLLILFNLLWVIINVVFTRYRMELKRNIWVEIKKIIKAVILFTGMISIFAFLLKELYYSRLVIYGSITFFFVGLIVSHLIFYYTLRWIRKKGKLMKRVLIVGDDHASIEFADELDKDDDVDYEILVYIDSDSLETSVDHWLMVGKLVKLKTIFKKEKFDELYIVVSSSNEDEVQNLVDTADYYGIRVRMIPAFYKLFQRNFEVKRFHNIPIINVNEIPLDRYYNWFYKRVFDLFFSLFALLVVSPLLIIIALSVKLTSRGPLLFVVKRVGMEGDVFKMYKFRTMYYSEEDRDTSSTQENDSRITPLGHFLRKTNLDELPQFFNVLKGDMSVVGPRPHRIYLDKKLQSEVAKYMIRHYIKPGLTGWAQVNGWRGPTNTEEQKIQRTRHDLWYIKNWTFWLDIKIIFLTLFGKKTWENAF